MKFSLLTIFSTFAARKFRCIMNKNTRHILSLLLLLWAALTPATAKAAFDIPYINDFEGQNSLSGWNLEDGQCFVHTDANHTSGGSRCLEIGCSDCTYHYIVLPEFTAYTNTLRMTFYLAMPRSDPVRTA